MQNVSDINARNPVFLLGEGMSVAECGTGFCTFHFHPSSGRDSESTYAMTVKFLENGTLRSSRACRFIFVSNFMALNHDLPSFVDLK